MRFDDVARLVDDRADQGLFRVHRDIFTDPAVYELEMRYIFEGTWVYLGMASQLPKNHDYLTTWIGRQPVVVMRDGQGRLAGFLNTCRHRGATLCHTERGNAKYHVCHYHGWAFDSSGRNVDIKDRKHGCYTQAFDSQDHDLIPLAGFGEYRGFMFGSLNKAVLPLEDHLGDTRRAIDLIVEQSPKGVELVPGSSSYVYKGNWKLQIENCSDIYHLTSTHRSFMTVVDRRNAGDSGHQLQAVDVGAIARPTVVRGSYTFPNGHAMVWGINPTPHIRPLYAQVEELRARVGDSTANWMLASRNLTLYPNLQIADNASLQLRIIRPLSVDRTEMRIFCLAPIGESDEAREYRLRQYEDFFNATGMATPDDNVSYEDCQRGNSARGDGWLQGYSRGLAVMTREQESYSKQIGVTPATAVVGPFGIGDETVYHSGYRQWLHLMKKGFERDFEALSNPQSASVSA